MLLLEFIFALAAMVILHELGHFIACRIFNVEVEEFGLGFPPRATTLFEAGGTKFTLNWLPFGGFVRPKGENDPSIPGGLAAANPWVRMAVFAAGPLMNLLSAILLFAVIASLVGKPDPARLEEIQIDAISPDSPAEAAGLQINDILVTINDQVITNTGTAHNVIYANLGKPVTFVIRRQGSEQTLEITPRENPPANQGAVGILMGTPRLSISVIAALPEGAMATYLYGEKLLSMIGDLIRGNASPDEGRLVGFKGMYDVYETVRTEPVVGYPPIVDALGFFASISISLGLLNLLPIPALDGGRIVFALPEIVIRRRIPQEYENWVNGISFILLIVLMIFVNLRDFINPPTLP